MNVTLLLSQFVCLIGKQAFSIEVVVKKIHPSCNVGCGVSACPALARIKGDGVQSSSQRLHFHSSMAMVTVNVTTFVSFGSSVYLSGVFFWEAEVSGLLREVTAVGAAFV